MASKRVEKILRIIRQWHTRMDQMSEADAVAYEKLARSMERRIIRAIRAKETTTRASQAELMSDLRKIMQNGMREVVQKSRPSILRVLAEAIERDGQALTVAAANTKRVVQLVETLQEQIAKRTILREWDASGEWARQWGTRTQAIIDRVQDEFSHGVRLGKHSNVIADAIERDLASLNVPGVGDSRTFARAFVRTRYTELSKRFSENLGEEAGLDYYVNIGTSDDRQAQECYEASNEAPKTLENWEQWSASNGKGGTPPRHINCRCSLAPIPNVMRSDDWSQPNDKFEEVLA
jgi:hypothetical protein